MRNFQRPAQISAESLVKMAGLGHLISGDGIWPCVERRTLVTVVKTESNAIHRLAAQSSAAASAVSPASALLIAGRPGYDSANSVPARTAAGKTLAHRALQQK